MGAASAAALGLVAERVADPDYVTDDFLGGELYCGPNSCIYTDSLLDDAAQNAPTKLDPVNTQSPNAPPLLFTSTEPITTPFVNKLLRVSERPVLKPPKPAAETRSVWPDDGGGGGGTANDFCSRWQSFKRMF